MSNKEKNTAAENANVPATVETKKSVSNSVGNIYDPSALFKDENGFEDTSTELLSVEFLQDMLNTEFQAIATKKVEITIKEKPTEAVELHIMTEEGVVKRYATQFKFKQIMDIANLKEDEALALRVKFLGKVTMKGSGKTVNEFDIKQKVVKIK